MIIHTLKNKNFKPNRDVYQTDMALLLQKKVGKKDKKCTNGLNTDLFLWINGVRSIESTKVNRGASVSTHDGKIGKIYFGSFPAMGKIKVYMQNKMKLYYPKQLTIISFF